MRYIIVVLTSGDVIEGQVVSEDASSIVIEGQSRHIDPQKDDLLEIRQAAISANGVVINPIKMVIEKKTIIGKILEIFQSKDPLKIDAEFVDDDEAYMGRGYYNKATGRRLLKTKPTTVPFGGCVVEVIETDIFENTPLATVRVYQANNYYEGIVYREDHDLEDYSESK